jgi:hypothetical protein
LLAWSVAGVAAGPADQSAVKAAFIYNFAAFTTWPAAMEQRLDLTVCFESRVDAHLQRALGALVGKPVRTREVRVLSFGAVVEVSDCDVLVLGADGLAVDPALRAKLAGRSVLTVCDCASGTSGGEIIRLFDDRRRLGFMIDVRAAAEAHLEISSKLLRLARSP